MSSGVFNARSITYDPQRPTSGTVGQIKLITVDQIAPIPADLEIGKVYGVWVDPQIVGEENYSLWVNGGDSVIRGRVVPASPTDFALRLAARPDGDPNQELFMVEGPLGNQWFRVKSDGTGGFGPEVSGATWYVNNVSDGSGQKVALAVRQAGDQVENPFEVQASSGAELMYVDAGGAVFAPFFVARDSGTNLKLATFGGGVVTANGVQVEVKGHVHTADEVIGALKWSNAPTTASDPGIAGSIAADSEFFYVCVGADRWKRTPLTTW
jgi:hypothetical protein